MYITDEDVEKIAKVMKDFPGANSYKLEQSNQSGIGSILSLIIDTKVNGHESLVTVEISGVESW